MGQRKKRDSSNLLTKGDERSFEDLLVEGFRCDDSPQGTFEAAWSCVDTACRIEEQVISSHLIPISYQKLSLLHNWLVQTEHGLAKNLQSDSVLLQFRKANPFAAMAAGHCRESFVEIASVVALRTLDDFGAAIDRVGRAERMMERLHDREPSEWPAFSGVQLAERGAQLFSRFSDDRGDLRPLLIHLKKEVTRVTGESPTTIPEAALTPADSAVIEAIEKLVQGGTSWPTNREIAPAAGYTEQYTKQLTGTLLKRGLLIRGPNNAGCALAHQEDLEVATG